MNLRSERFQGNIELQSPDDPFRMPLYGTDVCGGDDERICFSIPLLPDSFDETDTVSVPVNEIISVSLFADIDISSCYSTTANPQFNCTTLGPGSLDMLVTAGLEIDPSFAALNPGYELLISPISMRTCPLTSRRHCLCSARARRGLSFCRGAGRPSITTLRRHLEQTSVIVGRSAASAPECIRRRRRARAPRCERHIAGLRLVRTRFDGSVLFRSGKLCRQPAGFIGQQRARLLLCRHRPYPWPSLNLQTTVAAGGNTSASASFDYWIEIFNPAPAASSVPVLVYTNLSSGRPTANDTVHANISLNAASDPPYTPLYVQGICDAFVGLECHFAPANSEETDTVSIPVNEPIHVTLYADANLSSCFRDFLDPTDTCPSPVDSGQSDVFVGMTFQIDPAFLAVDPGYALFASAGLGPDLAVDEPLTVSLFGAGAAMLALLRRRRRIAVTSRPAPSTL